MQLRFLEWTLCIGCVFFGKWTTLMFQVSYDSASSIMSIFTTAEILSEKQSMQKGEDMDIILVLQKVFIYEGACIDQSNYEFSHCGTYFCSYPIMNSPV